MRPAESLYVSENGSATTIEPKWRIAPTQIEAPINRSIARSKAFRYAMDKDVVTPNNGANTTCQDETRLSFSNLSWQRSAKDQTLNKLKACHEARRRRQFFSSGHTAVCLHIFKNKLKGSLAKTLQSLKRKTFGLTPVSAS